MVDVIGRRRWFYAFSLLITIPGLLFILLTPLTNSALGLKFSIDYTGGTEWELKFANPNVTAAQIKAVLATQDLADSTVNPTSNGFFDVRTKPIGLPPVVIASATPVPTIPPSGASAAASGSAGAAASASATASASAAASPSASASASAGASAAAAPSASSTTTAGGTAIPTTGKIGELAAAFQKALGPIADQRTLTTVGPIVSADLIQQAIILIFAGSIGILTWITVRFHDVRFGVAALVALLHDVIVVVGSFALLGTLFGVEIDALFVTAMLTVIGFSVHDTIVVFDRIRENRARHVGEPFDRIVNHSVLQTFGRSINTSFTVVLTLLALLLFGGSAIRFFVLALLIGITSGTYSSVFNASPILVTWHEWDAARKARAAGPRGVRRAAS
ncbi:MAG: protein translocase subunit SecF [Candidatus Limnocylindrales bacterium]